MARNRKKKYENERNPLRMVLYIILVAVLIGCLVFMAYYNRRRHKEYNEKVAEVAANETEYVVIRKDITENSETAGAEDETAKTGSGKQSSDQSVVGVSSLGSQAGETKSKGTKTETEAASESEAETEIGTESESASEAETAVSAALKKISVVVLNGTDRSGVAAYWKAQLQEDGYQSVTAGTYTLGTQENTTIYTSNAAATRQLKKVFPNATFKVKRLSEGIELADGEVMPDQIDVGIVVGNADAVTE
ncbi:MAG: LytR C-terminal domain-containing protein [Lachnospiraceae bacterium]|nr:LytR C-terminal domain-containing protein [Lachnospiraceae bacterium]